MREGSGSLPAAVYPFTSSRSTSGAFSLLARTQTLECCVAFFQPLPFSGASCSDDYIKGDPKILSHLLPRGLALSGCSSAGSVGLGNAFLVALASLHPTCPRSEEKGLGF